MVMHARKIPRLSDGYYDKNQAHPFEDKYPSKSLGSSHGERYESSRARESPSYRGNRDYSPPRSSSRVERNRHLERAKEKGSTSSPGERRPNHYASSSNHERGSSRQERDRNSESKPAASSSKDHKLEFQKSALRVSGDWSEHRSSSGKKYYYNCRTEVSQWEKPKDWIDLSLIKSSNNDPTRNRDKNGREGNSRPALVPPKSYDERYRHSNSGGERSLRGGPSATQTSPYGRAGYVMPSEQRLTTRQDSHDYRGRNSDSKDPLSGRRDVLRTTSLDERSLRRMDELQGSHKAHHRHDLSFNGVRTMSTTPRNDNEDSRQPEDMDISPDNTPGLSSRPTSRHGTPAASTPSSSIAYTMSMATAGTNCQADPRQHHHVSLNTHYHPPVSSGSTNPTLSETIETLKTLKLLQEALIAQTQQLNPQVHHQPSMVNSNPQLDVISPALRSPQVTTSLPNRHLSTMGNNSRNSSAVEDNRLVGSPPHENNYRSTSRESPTSSVNHVHGLAGVGPIAAAVSRKPDSIQLTPSLLNHFDEKLIGHVTGWPTEPLERHADRFSEEINGPGCIQCSRVIVELKKARSMVRIAEILSTPKEQRVLFLRQQIKDLENMKGQSCYMSYQDT